MQHRTTLEKLIAVCLICVGIVTVLGFLISFFTNL